MTAAELLSLAALPTAEWRLAVSTMTYYTTHPEAEGFVMPDCLDGIYTELPDAEEWDQLRLAVAKLRSEAVDASAGESLSRKEYMRNYMRRRRAGRV